MQSNKPVQKVAVSEKAERLKAQNKYVFAVPLKANKNEIKKFVTKELKVEVLGVNIVRTKKGKKAIVSLKPGSTINEKI